MNALLTSMRFHARHAESIIHGYPSFNPDVQDVQGVAEDAENTVYLRRRQHGIFVNPLKCRRTSRKKDCVWNGQIGKSFQK